MTTKTLQKSPSPSPLPWWVRFYFYGVHGVLDEVVFTAIFDLLLEPQGNPHLKGYTTFSTFFVYGSGIAIVEQFFLYCIRRGYPSMYRVPVYVLAIYVNEFCWGLALRQIDACPWDYSHYPLNFMGLVTLVYAPIWFIGATFQDYIYCYLNRLRVWHGDIRDKVA